MRASASIRRDHPVPSSPRTPLVVRTDFADELASPMLVDALAAAIVQYSFAAVHAASGEPLDVYDLAPGQGVLAVRLLRALQRHHAGHAMHRPFRLHLCASHVEVMRLAARHPLLREALDQGQALRSRWDPCRDGAQGEQPSAAAVFIALGYFQQLPVQLGAAHYGQWLEGELERQPWDEQGGWPLAYRWSPRSSEPGDATLHGLRQLYMDKLGSAAVNLPQMGMRVLRHMDQSTGGHYLLLAADLGASCLRDIALGALAPPDYWRDGVSAMPVNFHALSWMQPNARIIHPRSTSEGPVLHVALAGEHDDVLCNRIAGLLAEGVDHPQAARDMAAWLPQETPLSVRLAHLRRCACDPRLLLHSPGNSSEVEPPDRVARQAWGEALERCWVLAQDEPDHAVAEAVGMWAAHLGGYGLAVRVLGPAVAQLAPVARDYLAIARLHTGDLDGALACLATSVGQETTDPLRTYLHACRDSWAQLPWYHLALARDDELFLQPLAAHHAPAWLEQYRDPHIGVMTRLPELSTLELTQAWIAEQQADPSRAVFAVVHREHGFVGSVCYQRSGDSAYFHFWIGTDHQGLGIGRRAGELACRQSAACGVQRLFTSVYVDNQRSRAALSALGFESLAVRAEAPDDDLLFLRRGLAAEAHATDEHELCALLAANGSPIQLSLTEQSMRSHPTDHHQKG